MAEEQKTPDSPSETVIRLRETFTHLAATLKPEDETAIVYTPGPKPE